MWVLILAIGMLNNLGQNLSTWINQRANPATVSIMSYCGIVFSFMLDVLVFHFSFTTMEICGVLVCLFFSIIATAYKHFITKKKSV